MHDNEHPSWQRLSLKGVTMYVKVKGWKGIAFYVVGHPQTRRPEYVYLTWEDEETGEQTEQKHLDIDFHYSEGEMVDDTDRYIVIMVGDDRKHTVDVEDCEEISDEDFCSECGQMGCLHNRWIMSGAESEE